MIGRDGFAGITAAATVPEQVVNYVTAVAGSSPLLLGSCVGYRSENDLVLIGYPLHDPFDERAMGEAVEEALEIPGLSRITVIGPCRPPQAPGSAMVSEDFYSLLPVPPPPPGQKLRNMLRRADRELTVETTRKWEGTHEALVGQYLEHRDFDPATSHIFRNIPAYLEQSSGSLIFSAMKDQCLAAFAVGEFNSYTTTFFMFCFRDPSVAPPGSTDLLLSSLLDEAGIRGHTQVNLGLQINGGIRFFKRKWGEGTKLPYVQSSWEKGTTGFSGILRAVFSGKK